MKRRSSRVVCFALYILISCTMLSLKIEKEMLTQVETLTVEKSNLWGQPITLPQTALFRDEEGVHLYEVVEGSGWEKGLRVQEISRENYELDNEKGVIRLPGGRNYCFITTASRQPVEGELVEIVEAVSKNPVADQLLFVYPNGVPDEMDVPADVIILEKSSNAILGQVLRQDVEYFEHKQMMKYRLMAGKDWRVLSMHTMQAFCDQLPLVTMIVGGLLFTSLLWLYTIICPRSKLLGKAYLLVGIVSMVSVALEFIILQFTNLPVAILPDTNILNIRHYTNELQMLLMELEPFSCCFQDFENYYTKIIIKCCIIFGVDLVLAVLFLAYTLFLRRRLYLDK